jgi:hypothetical protein
MQYIPQKARFDQVHGDSPFSYLVLRMSGPNGVISIMGDIKQAYDCDRESCNMGDTLLASVEL